MRVPDTVCLCEQILVFITVLQHELLTDVRLIGQVRAQLSAQGAARFLGEARSSIRIE